MTDNVNGIVIGPIETRTRYKFFRNSKQVIAGHHFFRTDREAIEWIKTNHPIDFKLGLEMRVYHD